MTKRLFIFFFVFILIFLSACSMENLPTGEFVSSHPSPQNTYTLNIYLDGGGATVDFAIRGEIVYSDGRPTQNIYWNYHECEATVEWISDEIVVINGIELDVSKGDIYDWRTE